MGGGGDLHAALIKARTIHDVLRHSMTRKSYFLMLLELPFEPTYDPEVRNPKVEKLTEFTGLITVPAPAWMQLSEDQRKATTLVSLCEDDFHCLKIFLAVPYTDV